MKLIHVSERVWYYPFEDDRDRPILGYIKGDDSSLAVDAGHSAAHIAEFYAALQEEGLPLPAYTAITHWHWDHTFAMHAAHGLTIASTKTDAHLRAFRKRMEREGEEVFFSLDECIRREYADGQKVVITFPDILFDEEYAIDLGNCRVILQETEAPHTDDTTLVYVPSEKILFFGDAPCGVFPTWEKDPQLCQKLRETISALDIRLCIGGHWQPQTKQEMLAGLMDYM